MLFRAKAQTHTGKHQKAEKRNRYVTIFFLSSHSIANEIAVEIPKISPSKPENKKIEEGERWKDDGSEVEEEEEHNSNVDASRSIP